MHRKITWLTPIALFAAFTVWAAPGDGTFTFRIVGPDGEGASAQVENAPAPTTASTGAAEAAAPSQTTQTGAQTQARSSTPIRTPSPEGTTYTVQVQDTVWGIANRFLPGTGNVNAFQAAASIYRHNPDAFIDGNVNNLRRTTLNIPAAAAMAAESPQTGVDLLREGRLVLPPLGENFSQSSTAPQPAATTTTDTTTAVAATTAAETAALNPADNNVPAFAVDNNAAASQQAASNNDSSANTSAVLNPADSSAVELPAVADEIPPREYVARETMLRGGLYDRQENTDDVLLSAALDGPYNDDSSFRDNDDRTLTVQDQNNEQNSDASQKANLSEIDFKVIRELIDSTNKAIENSSRELDQKISAAISRSEKIASAAGSIAAKEGVTEVMARYESLISELQQSNAELRANLSKLGRQIEQVKEVSVENSETLTKLNEMIVDVEDDDINTIPQGPIMWILLGIGLMSLILASTLFIFKVKSRSTSREEPEEYSEDDDSAELISTQIVLNEEEQAVPEQDEGDGEGESPKEDKEPDVEPQEKSSEVEKAKSPKDSSKEVGLLDDVDIKIPDNLLSDYQEDKARKAAEAAKEENDGKPADELVRKAKQTEEDLIKAWEAVAEKEDDKDTLNEWEQALKEQEQSSAAKAEVAGKADEKVISQSEIEKEGSKALTPEEQMAKEWEDALKNQENQEENQKLSPDEQLAKEWEGSLNSPKEDLKETQGKGENNLTAEERMSKEWEEALQEQGASETSGGESPPKTQAPDDSDSSKSGAKLASALNNEALTGENEALMASDLKKALEKNAPLEQDIPPEEVSLEEEELIEAVKSSLQELDEPPDNISSQDKKPESESELASEPESDLSNDTALNAPIDDLVEDPKLSVQEKVPDNEEPIVRSTSNTEALDHAGSTNNVVMWSVPEDYEKPFLDIQKNSDNAALINDEINKARDLDADKNDPKDTKVEQDIGGNNRSYESDDKESLDKTSKVGSEIEALKDSSLRQEAISDDSEDDGNFNNLTADALIEEDKLINMLSPNSNAQQDAAKTLLDNSDFSLPDVVSMIQSAATAQSVDINSLGDNFAENNEDTQGSAGGFKDGKVPEPKDDLSTLSDDHEASNAQNLTDLLNESAAEGKDPKAPLLETAIDDNEDDKSSLNLKNDLSSGAAGKELSRDQREKLISDLNLAHLLFETGDLEEAKDLIVNICAQGSDDLVKEAMELKSRYAP